MVLVNNSQCLFNVGKCCARLIQQASVFKIFNDYLQRRTRYMQAKFEELIEGFITGNIGVSETFLSLPLAAALQKNLLQLDSNSQMMQAGIGNTIIKDGQQKIR